MSTQIASPSPVPCAYPSPCPSPSSPAPTSPPTPTPTTTAAAKCREGHHNPRQSSTNTFPPFQHPLATTPPQPLPQNKQKVKLVALKWDIEQLPLTRNAAPAHAAGKPSNNATLININVSSLAEEKLVDMDASSSKTISPMEPIVLSALTNRVVSR